MKIKASFVIPSKDCAHYLPAAVRSALSQDHPGVEVVLVDDGSTDGTEQYTDWLRKTEPRVKVIRNDRAVGRSLARNMGLIHAQADHIFVLDADDLSEPKRVSLCLRRFKENGSAFLYGGAFAIDAIGAQIATLRAEPITRAGAFERRENGIVHSTVAYTRSFAEKYPYSDGEAAKLGLDDWEQQVRALAAGETFEAVPHPLSCYRITRAGVTAQRNQAEVDAFKKSCLEAFAC